MNADVDEECFRQGAWEAFARGDASLAQWCLDFADDISDEKRGSS